MSNTRYPLVLFFRHDKYAEIDNFIEKNKDTIMGSIHIINNIDELNKLHNPNYHLLVTYGDTYDEYDYISGKIPSRFSKRWFHKEDISDIGEFSNNINYCYIANVIENREKTRPIFSIFTTCYKSYDYINMAYESIKKQSLKDWEWVIMDDTPEDDHFTFLKNTLSHDNRIRLYKRDKNSGNIGNVKNEVISLCRGKYILEMDHDDEILEDCLLDSYNIFQSDSEIGFVYGDTINLFRDGQNCKYTDDLLCKGYGGYYSEVIDGQWRFIYNTPNINNVTLSHLTCLPNHPRIWDRSVLMELENYSEFLPICDDYEILLRTCCSKYKVVKNNKPQYIQYMNNEGNNFSTIRNAEINRIGPKHISPMFYTKYGVHDKMKKLGAYEDPQYMKNQSDIWKRGPEYQHNIMNSRINLDYNKQYCIINDAIDNVRLKELYKDSKNDFLVLSNKSTVYELWDKLNSLGFGRMKCYGYKNCSDEELIKYFKMMYKNDNCDYEIIRNNNSDINTNEILNLSSLNVNYFKESFANASPFNHIILDNIINENLLNSALTEINNIPTNELLYDYVTGIENVQINKFCYRDFNKLKYISQIKDYLESDIFINWLEQVTGIDNLQKDTTHNGGGIHIIKQNGKLAIHSDFNRHKTTMKYRRLNLLLYLNQDYQEEYNGHLELWNKQMTSCEHKISPIFNRIVLFKVDDDANHGHPEIWNSENSNRTSLALYYYTDDRPEHEKSENYNAVWKRIQKPKCYIIHNNTVGGAYKFLTDTMEMYPTYEYTFIDSKQQLLSIQFNKSDLFILQNVLYTNIEIDDIIKVHTKYNFKLLIQIHDFQWLCPEQHQYTNDIPSAYLNNNINVSKDVSNLLLLADKIIMNSQFTYDIYSKHFDSSNFTVCYPSDYNLKFGIKNVPEIQNKCMNIGVFSPLCKFKGERYVNYLKSKYESTDILFQIVGQNIPYYNEKEFYDYIRKYNINGFLLLNEWGETYGYLLTKIINSGLPLLYNNFGAVKERLSGTQENMEHYFKVYDNEHNDDVTIDYTILESQFNQFVEYINTNNGTIEDMNEDMTIKSRPIYDEMFLPIINVYQNREIPKHVFQTSKEILPPYVKELINVYCPEWKYSHFTDKECIQFFIDNPISEFPNIIQKFHSFTQGQHKADLFRYYYLYLKGGVFLDSDAMFETTIDDIIQNYDSVFAKSYMKNEHLFNGFIATYPRNEIIYNALKHAYYTENHILQTNYHYLCEELLRIVNIEQTKALSQNMVIYQEHSDIVDSNSVGRFKNTNDETVFIHYWQNREIPRNLLYHNNNKTVMIPIGTFCYIARILEKLNYRYTSLPFDFIRSNIPMMNDCINNNFVDFLNKDNYTNNNQGIIKYGNDIFLHHDMGNTTVYDSMKRKTKRFLNLFDKHNINKVYIAFFQPIGSWGDDTTVHQDGTNIDKIISDLKQMYKTINNRTENFHVIGIINKPNSKQNNKMIFKEENLLIYELETISAIAGPTFTIESDELYSIKILKQILTTINPNFENTHVVNYENEIEIPSKLVNSLISTRVKTQNKKIGIFNSFPFHYEMFGFILNYAKNNNFEVDIFTNTQNDLGWLDFYNNNFSNFNIIDFNNFNGNTNSYEKLFVTTDDDPEFKTEWRTDNVICINHYYKTRTPIFKHYLNVAQFKDSTLDYINPCYNLNSFQNKIQNNTVNIIGGGYGLNFSIIKRLQSNNKIKLNIFVRHTDKINTDAMNVLDNNNFDIHFKVSIDTNQMINEINKSSYILINYNDNQDLNTGRSCSGSMQLALSTLCKPIIAKTANKYLQIENALEFDIDSDEPINIDDEIDFKAIEQERNKYVNKFESYMENKKVKKSNIPKKLFQTWETTNIEPEFQKIIDKWKEFNPDYEYIFHDSEQRLKFIQENFEENVVIAYNKIIPGAYKCDLWRYCVLYIYGGFYTDIDTLCMGKLNDLTSDNIDFIVPIDLNLNPVEGLHNLFNTFIAAIPKSQILLDAINMIVFNVENNNIPESKLDFSGPGMLGRAVNKFLKLEQASSFKGKEGIKNSINFLHFDSNTEYVSDINTNKIILQNKNKNSDIIRLYNNECNKINGFKSWILNSVSPISE